MPKSTRKKKKILARPNNYLGRYLDHASSTPIDPIVVSVINKELKENYANLGAIHELGLRAKNKLEKARSDIARILNVHADEIIFTSGATESNNLAILGIISKFSELFSEMHTYLPASKLLYSGCRPVQGISKNMLQKFSKIKNYQLEADPPRAEN